MKTIMKRRFLSAGLACIYLLLTLTGCGAESTMADPDDVELLEPAGVALNFEKAAYRDLYNAKVYGATVCPYVEEYSVENWGQFAGYVTLPGESVKKNQAIIKTNTEDLEKKIEEKEEYLAQMTEDYREAMSDLAESKLKPQENYNLYGKALENWAKEKPEQFLDAGNTIVNPAYDAWARDNAFYENQYMNASAQLQRLEASERQKTENYELDYNYQKLLLSRLQEDKRNNTLISGMDGVVANVKSLQRNEGMSTEAKQVAVADTNRKLLMSEFISKSDISRAEDVYAIINGERYEVEYQVMETEEYNRLQKENRKIYTTFYFTDDVPELDFGCFATIVVVSQSKKQVLTVPQEALTWSENQASLYLLQDGVSVQTSVKVGMKDGVYAEILSGVEEGDKIITDKAMVASSKTVTLERGNISSQFSESGRLAYPKKEWVGCSIKYGTAYFVDFKVSINQQVSKGEVLAEIRVTADDIALEKNEKKLARERERLQEYKKQNTDDTKQVKKVIEAKEETIAELEKTIAEMKADFATTKIVAPYDGIVTMVDMWRCKEGDLLSNNQSLAQIAEQDSNYVSVSDKNGRLNFGDEATIEYTNTNGQTVSVTGTVVTLNESTVSPELFETEFNEGNALIRIAAEDIGDMAMSSEGVDGWWSPARFKVKVTTRSMENVVLVPKNAVSSNGTTTYVKLVRDNGEVIYQSFVAGGSDGSYYWVAEGLTEGMEVCIE